MDYLVLDTDVASLIQKGRLPAAVAEGITGYQHCVTFVSLGELAKWALLQGWGIRKWTELADWLRHVVVLPYDDRVAYLWGELQAAGQKRGRRRPINDTWIAACCLAHGLPLVTLNVKDFEDFAEYHGLRLIGR